MSSTPPEPKRSAELAALRADIAALLQLTRHIGHDLNNVLQGISSCAERLAEDEDALAQALSSSILTSVAAAAVLTRQLLVVDAKGGTSDIAGATTAPGTIPFDFSRPAATPSATPARILVVDDQEAIRELTKAILTHAGYEVVLATSGAAAVAAVRDTVFALVLMDVQMPLMNGLTATRKIRQIAGPQSSVPIIAMSANVPLQHVRSLVSSGMNDHIGKPFRRAALLQLVDTWINPGARPPVAPQVVAQVSPPQDMDTAAFAEAQKLMGRPWVERGLARLGEHLEETFGAGPEATAQDPRLATRAHAVVSLAGFLGFAALARLCSVLEEACRGGIDAQPAFEEAKATASHARQTAANLIAAL